MIVLTEVCSFHLISFHAREKGGVIRPGLQTLAASSNATKAELSSLTEAVDEQLRALVLRLLLSPKLVI